MVVPPPGLASSAHAHTRFFHAHARLLDPSFFYFSHAPRTHSSLEPTLLFFTHAPLLLARTCPIHTRTRRLDTHPRHYDTLVEVGAREQAA